jgi:hypothetical protein
MLEKSVDVGDWQQVGNQEVAILPVALDFGGVEEPSSVGGRNDEILLYRAARLW